MSWAATNARARGLASRLLPRAELARLARAERLEPVRDLVSARGFPLAAPAGVDEIEEAIRLGIGAELRTLDRWLDPSQRLALAPLFAEEDRRSLRRILRGLASGIPPGARAAKTLPTPSLSAAALDELARQPTPQAVAGLLTLWRNPFGPALSSELREGEPHLLRLELALDRTLAELSRRASRRAGRSLRDLAASRVDGMNAAAALLLADGERELPAEECFLDGGRVLGRPLFLAAASASGALAAARRLAPAFAGETGRALRRADAGRPSLDEPLLADAIAAQRRLAVWLPLSPAPTASYLLALRREAVALRAAAWRVALGLPGEGDRSAIAAASPAREAA